MPFLRLRSDEQLVTLFRSGSDEAFRVIHDRYRKRLFAYTRQMLPGSRQDAEDALQDVFIKAYAGLRADDREVALRAWLYRVAHNRCIDQLRRAHPIVIGPIEFGGARECDPIAAAEQRETLRRLIADVQRLPAQQRSALLMRELSGMSYAELAAALAVSVPAVKSLLVRARLGLAAAVEARETSCLSIREELVHCHDRGVRPTGMARRHLRDCPGCRDFRRSVRGVSRNFAVLTPALGPLGIVAKLLGGGGAGAAGTGGALSTGSALSSGGAAVTTGGAAVTTGGAAVTTGSAIATGGAMSAGGAIAGGFAATTAGHVATLLAAAIVTAGGAVAVQPIINHGPSPSQPRVVHTLPATPAPSSGGAIATASSPPDARVISAPAGARLTVVPDSTKRGAVGRKRRAGEATTSATTGELTTTGTDAGATTGATGTGVPGVPGSTGLTGSDGQAAGSSGTVSATPGSDAGTAGAGDATTGTGSAGSSGTSGSAGTSGTSTDTGAGTQTGTTTDSGGASSSPGSAWGPTGGSGTYSASTATS